MFFFDPMYFVFVLPALLLALDAQGFAPLKIRSAIVPAVQFGSMLGPLLFFVGLILHFTGLAWVGVAFFGMALVFSVLTLPVELDASRRAMQLLNASGLVSRFEADGV